MVILEEAIELSMSFNVDNPVETQPYPGQVVGVRCPPKNTHSHKQRLADRRDFDK